MKTIILGISGSIAAYKAAEIVSQFTKRDYNVHAVLTPSASEFISPLTLQTLSRNPVLTDVFAEKNGWQPGHIALADTADLLLVAPATADIIAKLALGLADDAISSLALACRAPLVIAPAMNGKMWTHPATVANAKTLIERGAEFIGPEEGMLACGYQGIGRLWPVEKIVTRCGEILRT
ncbi:MAG: phosphopantothenoylcysteine decarboxylase [Verrucomicrobia bacterium]|nr:MAG: phosphopantothenoylcysteine decarboxylase [Verrucomicrobiota bacterium]